MIRKLLLAIVIGILGIIGLLLSTCGLFFAVALDSKMVALGIIVGLFVVGKGMSICSKLSRAIDDEAPKTEMFEKKKAP